MPAHKNAVLITFSGQDAPGITSELTGILARHPVELLDIGQAVIHDLLSLSILVDIGEAKRMDADLIRELTQKSVELGLKTEFRSMGAEYSEAPLAAKGFRYAVTLIADKLGAEALHQVTGVLARHHVNIDVIKRLSEVDFGCVEMQLSSRAALDRHAMKKELLELAKRLGVDIALQVDGIYRRSKRLVVFDMDSTLIQGEMIDEFAREKGVYDEVAAITREAMGGKLDFDESLRRRCAALAGLTEADIDRVYQRVQLTPGAAELIQVLKRLGYKTAVISGGFTCVADRLKERLALDYAYSNALETKDGKLTGKVTPPIVNADRKAELLRIIARQEKIVPDQVIAVGDGANDIPMIEAAGLGVAFNAKPVVRERADLSLTQTNLRSILYLLGISGRELSELSAGPDAPATAG